MTNDALRIAQTFIGYKVILRTGNHVYNGTLEAIEDDKLIVNHGYRWPVSKVSSEDIRSFKSLGKVVS